jgi:hypothetical protein
MKISLLNKRENFDEIFLSSLKKFLIVNNNYSTKIVAPGYGDISFRKNSLLNLIYTNELPLSVKSEFINEFKYSQNFLRHILQNIYCYFAVKPLTQKILSPIFFDIVQPSVEMRTWLILPGNHSIRIIDTKKNYSIVFAKKGFDVNFLRTDALTRTLYPYLPAPKILKSDSNWMWYVEERIHGVPLNKISDPSQRNSMFLDAQRSIAKLRDDTLVEINLKDYFNKILSKTNMLINEIHQLEDTLVTELHKMTSEISKVNLYPANYFLGLCQSHGDFQPANILASKSSIWIIDWEYSAQRSTMYDFLIFTTMSRSCAGLASRLFNQYINIKQNNGVDSWGYFQKGDPLYLLSIFLIEDLHLRLKELQTDAIFNKKDAIKPWLTQIQKFYCAVNNTR